MNAVPRSFLVDRPKYARSPRGEPGLRSRSIERLDELLKESSIGPVWLKLKGLEEPVVFKETLQEDAPILGIIEWWAPRLIADTLSAREMQVFFLLAQGWGVTQIGKEVHLSIKTVSTYRVRILRKLGLSGQVELAVYAHEHKITTWPFEKPCLGKVSVHS